MRYGIWGTTKAREHRDFAEKAYRRQPLAAWDARWQALSVQARYFFLHEIKGPVKRQGSYPPQPNVPIDKLPPGILQELTDSGFLAPQPGRFRSSASRVGAADSEGLLDFATRVRSL